MYRSPKISAGPRWGQNWQGVAQSLIVTCRLHDIDPYDYLVDVLQRVGQHPASEVAQLCPCGTQRAPPTLETALCHQSTAFRSLSPHPRSPPVTPPKFDLGGVCCDQ